MTEWWKMTYIRPIKYLMIPTASGLFFLWHFSETWARMQSASKLYRKFIMRAKGARCWSWIPISHMLMRKILLKEYTQEWVYNQNQQLLASTNRFDWTICRRYGRASQAKILHCLHLNCRSDLCLTCSLGLVATWGISTNGSRRFCRLHAGTIHSAYIRRYFITHILPPWCIIRDVT